MLRVMLVAGSFPPRACGVGDYIARLAQALSALGGINVSVLTHESAALNLPSDVQILGVARRWGIGEMLSILRGVRQWDPHVVHIHYPSQGFYGRLLPALLPLACRALGVTVVQTWHEPWPRRSAVRVLLQRAGAHGLIFVRPGFGQTVSRWLWPVISKVAQTTVSSAGVLPVSSQTSGQRQALRNRYLQGQQRLIVFFGFLYPSKGVEQLFDIADPACDALVIAGASNDPAYTRRLGQAALARGWGGQVHYTGFLPEANAADLLAAADAVVLPFLTGAGDWNTSVHGALAQGTLVITTAERPTGDDTVRNLYTARISDVAAMRTALRALAGRRVNATQPAEAWGRIARSHQAFYDRVRQIK